MKNAEQDAAYRRQLFSNVPIYTTRLVREGCFHFAERDQVNSPEDVAAVLLDYFEEKDREEFVVCLLDTANTLIGMSTVSVGGLSASIVEARQVFKLAALTNAASIVCCHNHVSGNPEPSRDDIKITRQLAEVGKLMGIPLLDHLIICESDYVSLAEKGLM